MLADLVRRKSLRWFLLFTFAVAGLPLLFMPGVNLALGGPLTSLIGWIPLIAFTGWLAWSKRLPVAAAEEASPTSATSDHQESGTPV